MHQNSKSNQIFSSGKKNGEIQDRRHKSSNSSVGFLENAKRKKKIFENKKPGHFTASKRKVFPWHGSLHQIQTLQRYHESFVRRGMEKNRRNQGNHDPKTLERIRCQKKVQVMPGINKKKT